MRIAPLALLPAAWLALIGAAPADLTFQEFAECRASYEQAIAVMTRFDIARTIDRSKAPDRYLTRVYAVPATLTTYGYTPLSVGSADIVEGSDARLLIMAVIDAPYDEVEQSVLAANKLAACPRHDDGKPPNCRVFVRTGKGWRTSLQIRQVDNRVALQCAHVREPI